MTDKTYKYRLMVDGKIAYESTIERPNAKEALSWGFYWLPNHWIQRKPHHVARIHAEICIVHNDRQTSWKTYDSNLLEDASNIRNFGKEDLRHLLAGQDLVWKIVDDKGEDVSGRLFRNRHDAVHYIDSVPYRFDVYPKHIWVDGWYDEQFSWEATGVKGYELKDEWDSWEDEE